MNPFIVIETDDILQYAPACDCSGGVIFMMNQFFLDDTVKGFNTGIVVTVAFATHTGRDTIRLQ